MTWPVSHLSVLIRRLVHGWVRFYYAPIEISGSGLLPQTGPVLLVANHANSLIDPVLVSIAAGRQVHFLAKAPLFDVPLFGRFLHALGMIPAYRGSDDRAQVMNNLASLEAGATYIVKGEAVGIFPEGRSHDQMGVERVRSGAARLAIEAVKAGVIDLRVVPIGLNYEAKEKFRSAVWLQVGKPIVAAPGVGELPGDEKRWIRDLTENISRELKACVIHLEDPTWAPFVDDLETFFPPLRSGNRALSALQQRKRIAGAFNYFLLKDPARAEAAMSQLTDYKRKLAGHGLDFRSDLLRHSRLTLVARQTFRFLWFLLGLLPALLGTLHHLIPFAIVRAISFSVQAPGRSTVSLARLGFGLPIYGLWYAFVWSWMAHRYFLPWVAWVWAIAIPFAGLHALRYWPRSASLARRWWREVAVFFRPADVTALRLDHRNLQARLEELAGEYREAHHLTLEGKGTSSRALWVRRGGLAGALLLAVLVVWFAGRPTPPSSLLSGGLDWARVSNSSLASQLTADEKATTDVLSGLSGLQQRVGQLRQEFAAGDRNFYRVADNDAVRQQMLAYLNYRTVLLRMIWKYQDYKTIAEERLRLRAFLVSYVAGLSLYEASSRFVNDFSRSPQAMRKLNEADPAWGIPGGLFDMVRRNLRDPNTRSLMTRAADAYARIQPLFAQYGLIDTKPYRDFHGAIQEKKNWIDAPQLATIGAPLLTSLEEAKQESKGVIYRTKSFVSSWIGDTKIREPRDGRSLIQPEQVLEVKLKLKPGDILLERRNWFLSNAFLPGYWPHSAIYVGTAEDLTRMGLDKDPRVARFWKQFCELDGSGHPHTILEAVSEGVVFSSLDHSIGGGDSAAALRPTLSPERIRECIARAFTHVGKPYDFEFDFFSSDKLVCTELVYRSYDGEIDFPLVTLLGTRTMPAIELVRKCAKEKGTPQQQLEFVFFLEGSEFTGKAVMRSEEEFTRTLHRAGLTWLQPR